MPHLAAVQLGCPREAWIPCDTQFVLELTWRGGVNRKFSDRKPACIQMKHCCISVFLHYQGSLQKKHLELFLTLVNPSKYKPNLQFLFSSLYYRFVWFRLIVRALYSEIQHDGISHFSGIFPLAQGGLNPFNQTVGAPDCLGLGRDPMASSGLTPYNSCDLTPPMRGTQQIWNLV